MATLQSKIEGWEVGTFPESSLFPSVTENEFINQQPSMFGHLLYVEHCGVALSEVVFTIGNKQLVSFTGHQMD